MCRGHLEMEKVVIEQHSDNEWNPVATLKWDSTKNKCEMDMQPSWFRNVVSLGLDSEDTFFSWKQDSRSNNAIIPPFLYDLLPQGSARDSMLHILHLTSRDARADWPILINGAVNPIGNLRLSSAVNFWQPMLDDARLHKDRYRFTAKQVADRDEDFVEAMRLFGFIASGGGSIQGASPKFLLTRDQNGYFMPDLLVDDTEATAHYIVKYPRSKHESDSSILMHETLYMRIAEHIGLRSDAVPITVDDSFWMQRFDRKISHKGVTRLHQESLMSAAGIAGFGQTLTHDSVLALLYEKTSRPADEMLEYIKRDMLNVVLGNTDNHGRNTALQITETGIVQMTPVFDIAPMFLDREAIPRQTRWGKEFESQAGLVDWSSLADRIQTEYSYTLHAEIAKFKKELAGVPELLEFADAENRVIERSKRGLALIEGEADTVSNTNRVRPS
jgi:serine/threonine-protein kinase HipA